MAIPREINPIRGPQAAVRFVGNPSRDSDRTPAIIWLTIALLALFAVRRQALPTAQQVVTALVAIGAIVLVGSFTSSRLVMWVLVALVVAAGLGAAPQLIAWVSTIQAKGISVARGQ